MTQINETTLKKWITSLAEAAGSSRECLVPPPLALVLSNALLWSDGNTANGTAYKAWSKDIQQNELRWDSERYVARVDYRYHGNREVKGLVLEVTMLAGTRNPKVSRCFVKLSDLRDSFGNLSQLKVYY